ncbi:hypothetical protein TIFTF001_017156 [Ficus carica]|uniref:Uncharacterized protein n=1 Tax=Ficus carica TaxID=3494 RepID=A0AA88DAG6_FICCA|nr:hypothetical protein TIFTF001_017156 [Ficus carica]
MEELTEMNEQGTLKVEGNNDILPMTLGTPEHLGKVCGAYMTLTAYFHKSTMIMNELAFSPHQESSNFTQPLNQEADIPQPVDPSHTPMVSKPRKKQPKNPKTDYDDVVYQMPNSTTSD